MTFTGESLVDHIKPFFKESLIDDVDRSRLYQMTGTMNAGRFGRYAAGTLRVFIGYELNHATIKVRYDFRHEPRGWNPKVVSSDGTVTIPMYPASNFDDLGIDPSELIDSRYPQESCE